MYNLGTISRIFKVSLRQNSPIVVPNVSRFNLPPLFARLGYKTGAEIGTQGGYFSEKICQANPQVKLYCIDTWENSPEMQKTAMDKLAKYNVSPIKKTSIAAVKNFFDSTLDFAFFGSDSEQKRLAQNLDYWLKVVKPGGIIAGHNYNDSGVRKTLLAYTKENQISPWFVLHKSKLIDTWMIVKVS